MLFNSDPHIPTYLKTPEGNGGCGRIIFNKCRYLHFKPSPKNSGNTDRNWINENYRTSTAGWIASLQADNLNLKFVIRLYLLIDEAVAVPVKYRLDFPAT